MAINLLIGAPGGGKSYEAVAYHVLPALESGRKVITNLPIDVDRMNAVVPGSALLIEIRTETKATKPKPLMKSVFGIERDISGASTWINRPFAHVEDYADEWRDDNGRGPLYVIDECHFALPAGRTDTAVEEWYSMHRHYNVDVLLITQSYGKCSRAIIDLVQVCYKVRKATMLGDSNGYVRKVLDGVRGGEISVQQRKYEKKYFSLYRSHTHGTALAEKDPDDVSPFIVKFNRFKWAYVAVSILTMVWAFWPQDDVTVFGHRHTPKQDKQAALPSQKQTQPQTSAIAPLPVSSAPAPMPAIQASAVKAAYRPDHETKISDASNNLGGPIAGRGLHVTGEMHMGSKTLVTFVLTEQGKRIYSLTSIELEQAGYEVASIAPCFAKVTYKNTSMVALCDSTWLETGDHDRPVVIDTATGYRTDGRHKVPSVPVNGAGQRDYFDFAGAAINAPRPQTAVQAVRAAAS